MERRDWDYGQEKTGSNRNALINKHALIIYIHG